MVAFKSSIITGLLAFTTLASANNHFAGIVASSFTGSGGCKSAEDWKNLAKTAKDHGFKKIRVFGADGDCNVYDLVSAAAKAHGLKVLVGVYANSGTIDASKKQIDHDVELFIKAVHKHGVELYDGLTIGNEVNDSAQNIMNKVLQVRKYLHNAKNIKVPVSTVHIWVFIRDNPVMCNGDRVTANAHAYYDPNTSEPNAGHFVANTVLPALKSACAPQHGKIVITESGWPSSTGINKEEAALKSLNCASRKVPIYAFEADDQKWKSTPAERSFGIFGKQGLSLPSVVGSCGTSLCPSMEEEDAPPQAPFDSEPLLVQT